MMPRRSLSALIAFAALAGGCAQTEIGSPAASTASISPPALPAKAQAPRAAATKIALLLPLSGMGEPAHIAKGMKQAAEMALFEADNPAIQLIVKDDGGTPQGAMAAADAALTEGAEIVLGPLFGKSATSVAPLAAKRGVPVLSFSNDTNVAGRGVYLMSFLVQEEVERVVSFAASKGKRRFAALIPASTYGTTIDPAFRAAVRAANGELVRVETYDTADPNGLVNTGKALFAAIADAERAGKPVDALFVPVSPDRLGELGPLLSVSGVDTKKVKLLGTSAWDLPVVGRDDALIGGWYAASDPAAWTTFADKFRQTFGSEPPRLASLAYDATKIAVSLAGASSGPGRFSEAALTRSAGFTGVDGPIRFTSAGLSERGLAILETDKYRSVVIDAAPPVGTSNQFSSLFGKAK